MKKVMRLLSVQLWAVLSDMLVIGKTKSKKPKMLYLSVILFVVFMSGISFFYSFMIGSGLKMFGSLNILPAMMMSVTCIIIVMTTVFKVKGTIFGFRDYDMVMSLPVSTGAVVACRLIILYSFNFIFVIIMMVPMMVAYGILAEPNTLFYVICMAVLFFIPLVPIVIASVLGTLIAWAASKFRHSNLLNIVFSLGLLFVIVALSFTMEDNGKELVDIGKALTGRVNSMYPLAKMYTDAVINYDIVAMIMFISISVIAFLLYTIIIKLVFKKLNTAMMTGRSRANYKMGELKISSPFLALYKKEMKRYFSSSLYVMNTGFGIVMLTLGAIALLFVDLETVFGDPMAAAQIANSIPLFISFCVVMTCSSMASISLEGKSLWIMKSMPVTPKNVYLSKIAVNLTIAAPAVIDTALFGFIFKLGVAQTMIMVLVTIACTIFISFYGLFINLLLPNFTWTTEVIVIKQSAASMVTIFSAIGYVAIQFLFVLLLKSFLWAYLAYFLLTVVIDVVLYFVISSYGSKRYLKL